MSEQQHTTFETKLAKFQRAAFKSGLAAFGLFLVFLVLTGKVWTAVSYAVVALFAALFALAIYFWGTMIFGGLIEMLRYRPTPVPWALSSEESAEVDYNIDPGLELLAAGMLVYRLGEVRPGVYFRQVPLAHVRALRPFIVARTGDPRYHQFRFMLHDEAGTIRFDTELGHELKARPQLVMPQMRLVPQMSKRLIGQRWRLRVTSGATVVTTFGFMYVAGQERDDGRLHGNNGHEELGMGGQQTMLLELLNDALKREALSPIPEAVLEDL